MRENVFDDIASDYDNVLPEHISSHYLNKRLHFFLPYLKTDIRILDVGCGTGKLLAHFLNHNGRLKLNGCDSSMEMLRKTGKRGNIYAARCLSDCLPYKENMFDLVISVAVFHHLLPAGAVFGTLDEMIRVARKGGKVIIWDANSLNPYWLWLFKKIPHDREVKKIVPLRELVAKARKHSLEKIEVFRSGCIPDFAPDKFLPFLKHLEHLIECLPLIKHFSAHNILVFTK